MKVNSNGPGIELNAYLKQIRQQQQKTTESDTSSLARQGTETDKVNLSDRAREIQKATQSLQSAPDVREAKVEKIRMEIEKGTYKVVGAQVATDMMRESLENNLILQKVNSKV